MELGNKNAEFLNQHINFKNINCHYHSHYRSFHVKMKWTGHISHLLQRSSKQNKNKITPSVIYLCSCSCCSKLRGVSLQNSWQLAGLLAKTLAFWAEERLGLITVFRIITTVTSYNCFIIVASGQS